MDDRADFDNLAWDKNDEAFTESQKSFTRHSLVRKLESLVEQSLGKTASWVPPMRIGGYNNLYRMRLGDSDEKDDVMIRLPQPNHALFLDEKTLREAATGKFIQQKTQVTVSPIFSHGLSNPDSETGPFIILKHVDHKGSISAKLALPNLENPDDAHRLDPDISIDVLENFYGKIAVQYLHLFKPSFSKIGSLEQINENSFEVTGRPITQNMNNFLQLASIPDATLPPKDKTYKIANEYYIALAEMHIIQLAFQHNDLVKSADDCRNKYVARQLFLKLAKQGRLSTFGFLEDDWSAQSKKKSQDMKLSPAPDGSSNFRLWCDDLRPSNILLNKSDKIIAVIDWEFTYAAPTQFSLDPSWWLLLDVPEMWHTDIGDFAKIYDERLKSWLRAMEKAEETADTSLNGIKLSKYMKESWETGRFWLNYAARKSWAFDKIFWRFLDEKFFGARQEGLDENDLWKSRLGMFTEEERNAMEIFAERKMKESEERILVDWNEERVEKRMNEVLSRD